MTPDGPVPQITMWFRQLRLPDGWPFPIAFSEGKRCCLRLPLGFGVTLGFPCLGWVGGCSSTPRGEEGVSAALTAGSLQPEPSLSSRDTAFWELSGHISLHCLLRAPVHAHPGGPRPSIPPSLHPPVRRSGCNAFQHPELSSRTHPMLPRCRGIWPWQSCRTRLLAEILKGRKEKERRPGLQMKPELPLRDTVPMATASSALAAASSPFHLLLCASVHKSGAGNLLGRVEGAGAGPKIGCHRRAARRGGKPEGFCPESRGGASLGGQQSCDPPAAAPRAAPGDAGCPDPKPFLPPLLCHPQEAGLGTTWGLSLCITQ